MFGKRKITDSEILVEIVRFEELAARIENLKLEEEPNEQDWKQYDDHIKNTIPLLNEYQGESRKLFKRFAACENSFRERISYKPRVPSYYLRAEMAQTTL
jgi:hypothetical protein